MWLLSLRPRPFDDHREISPVTIIDLYFHNRSKYGIKTNVCWPNQSIGEVCLTLGLRPDTIATPILMIDHQISKQIVLLDKLGVKTYVFWSSKYIGDVCVTSRPRSGTIVSSI